ncbi:hypothetical protein [Pseudobacteriovorax antillogorgiicola]|nr:hypothetical protein [Pseudobacteriovorax antillogorgiicola]
MKTSRSYRIYLCFFLWGLLFHHNLFGKSGKPDPLNPFDKDYVTLELAGNFPIARSQELFSPYKKTWFLGYDHYLNRHWNVGISLGFKSYYRDALNKELALLSVSNHSLYVIRLYHPTYLMLGTKFIYMTPNEKSRFPLVKEPDFETEIGVGVAARLAHIQGPFVYSLRIDRWRGTKTNKLHGFEVAVGISYRLKK